MARSNEPFFWVLFSSGGMLSALVLPALVFALWIAVPLGWIEGHSNERLIELVSQPLVRAGLFAFIVLALFLLGAPIPLHALRRAAAQASLRTDRGDLLWKGHCPGADRRLRSVDLCSMTEN